jgi:hypothetical protein
VARESKKKVQFFEVCDKDGNEFAGPLPWVEALATLSGESVTDRLHRVGGVPHWGRTYTYNNRDHFVLARLREDGVSTFDIERDEFVDQESQAAVPFVEISVTSVLEGTNKFGLVRGSNASSHAASVGDWINSHQLFAEPITIVPLISKRTLDKINSASEVKLLDVSFSQELSASAAVAQAAGISTAVGVLVDELGPADIEVVIRRKGRLNDRDSDFRRKLAGLTRLAAGRPYTRAKAELVTLDEEGRPTIDKVDFVNDILARKMTVQLTDKEGNPVRIPSAIDAIEKAAAVLREDLED